MKWATPLKKAQQKQTAPYRIPWAAETYTAIRLLRLPTKPNLELKTA
jgi:hypothetical protein